MSPVGSPTPFYQNWTVYKGKGAMSVKVIPPTFVQQNSGVLMDQEGKMLLEFAAVGCCVKSWEVTVLGSSPQLPSPTRH